ncbi:MAG: Rieske (2Fe-2S) protein [Proteobacteria bacterium]|nr:Rieske (2Fe-2S) protein [Pseudomonadota bacterium]
MFKEVAKSHEVEINRSFPVELEGQQILLVRTEAGLFAVENSCPHQSQPLETATIESKTLTCCYHGVRIDLVTGELAYKAGYIGLGPALVYPVTEEDGVIRVDLSNL